MSRADHSGASSRKPLSPWYSASNAISNALMIVARNRGRLMGRSLKSERDWGCFRRMSLRRTRRDMRAVITVTGIKGAVKVGRAAKIMKASVAAKAKSA